MICVCMQSSEAFLKLLVDSIIPPHLLGSSWSIKPWRKPKPETKATETNATETNATETNATETHTTTDGTGCYSDGSACWALIITGDAAVRVAEWLSQAAIVKHRKLCALAGTTVA